MCSARVADRPVFTLIICLWVPDAAAPCPVPARDITRPAPNIMGVNAAYFDVREGAERQIEGSVQ